MIRMMLLLLLHAAADDDASNDDDDYAHDAAAADDDDNEDENNESEVEVVYKRCLALFSLKCWLNNVLIVINYAVLPCQIHYMF